MTDKPIEQMTDDELEAEFRRLYDRASEEDRVRMGRRIWDALVMDAYERGGADEVRRVTEEVRREVEL